MDQPTEGSQFFICPETIRPRRQRSPAMLMAVLMALTALAIVWAFREDIPWLEGKPVRERPGPAIPQFEGVASFGAADDARQPGGKATYADRPAPTDRRPSDLRTAPGGAATGRPTPVPSPPSAGMAAPAAAPPVGRPDRVTEAFEVIRGEYARLRDQNAALFEQVQGLREQLDKLEAQTRLSQEEARRAQVLARAVRRRLLTLLIDSATNTALELVYVPDGSFQMGRSEEDRIAANSATDGLMHNPSAPCHAVEIRDGYFLGKYEVTERQYHCFQQKSRGAAGGPPPPQRADLPVVDVSWQDARDFCEWVSRETGVSVRLPTEIEWEYAARGPSNARFASADNSETFENRDADQGPEPATSGGVPPSWCQAWHMSGNVSEWCADVWHEDAYKRAAQGGKPVQYVPRLVPEAWTAPPSAMTPRVYRGGAFGDVTVNCEAATRRWKTEPTRTKYLGFRIVAVFPE